MEIFLPSNANNNHNLRLAQLFKKWIEKCHLWFYLLCFSNSQKSTNYKAEVMSDYHKHSASASEHH